MVKKLHKVGNSYAIIINRPIMDLLKIDPDALLDMAVSPDGEGLQIRPVRAEGHRERVREAGRQMMEIHDATFRKLAE